MKLIIMVMISCLLGCGSRYVTGPEVEVGKIICKDNLGLNRIFQDDIGFIRHVTIVCGNGLAISIRTDKDHLSKYLDQRVD